VTTESWTRTSRPLHRADVDRRYQLWVDTPARFDPDLGDPNYLDGYPLILCLDAIWTFGSAVDVARILGLSKEVPRAIVAGVAHDNPDIRELVQERAMDFTITSAEAPRLTGVRAPAELLGGAEAMRQWIDAEVLPLLREEYPISEVTFVGHSFSALFGLHVLFNAPETYDHYLLASPSVWWDDRVMFDIEAQHAADSADLDAHVFMSKGSLEVDDFSPHKEFHDQLASRGHESLDLHWHEFPGETHSSVVSTAINRGLRVLLGPND
jgi:predicted alpha/beta superfamily hydrolase